MQEQGKTVEGFPLIPLSDIVIVQPITEEVTSGGIVIAGTSHAKMPQGKVMAVGPGRHYFAAMNASQTMEAAIFIPSTTRVGDTVVYGKYQSGGEPFEIERGPFAGRYVQCREGDLSCVVRDGQSVTLRVSPPA